MKSIIFPFLLCLLTQGISQGVEFQHLTLGEALERAQEENKLVFIDFMTVWCGPCKKMARDIFPLPEVGAYYNEEFVCLKLDAEQEGKDAADEYEVYSYPTLLYLDPAGNIVFKEGSIMTGREFIEVGKKAVASVDSEYSLENLRVRFPEKQHDEPFLKIYFNKMIEYGQDPGEGIDRWLSIQTQIREDSPEMYEFLLKYQRYLTLGGEGFEVFKANEASYRKGLGDWQIRTLDRFVNTVLVNTRKKALITNDAKLMKTFLDHWEETASEAQISGHLAKYEMEYYLMAKDYDAYRTAASTYLESIISKRTIAEIQADDINKYERYKSSTEGDSSATVLRMIELYEAGFGASRIMKEIHEIGLQYLEIAETSDHFKTVQQWISYEQELKEGYYLVNDLEAEFLFRKGKYKNAVVLKQAAYEEWPSYDKKRVYVERRLNEMREQI